MKEMKISIIIPVYNQEKYVEECLRSALHQDMEDYQVLMIDDGSTDASKEICLSYSEISPAFQYIYQENSGLGEARNTGIRHAEGRYLMFLDADDALEENCLGMLYRYMEETGADLIYTDEFICDETLRILYINPTYPFMQTQIEKTAALEYCLQPAHIWSRIYKRELFENVSFEPIWYEDMACFPRLVHAAERIGYYKVPLFYYRQHAGAITHQQTDVRNLDVIRAWDRALRLPGLSGEEKKAVTAAVRKSLVEFVFFRVNYAREYLAWYEAVLMREDGPGAETDLEQAGFLGDYPFLQQLGMKRELRRQKLLERLDELDQNGGSCFFDETKERIEDPAQEQLVLLENGGLYLHYINISAGSPVLRKAAKELRKQNLISRVGEVKPDVLEKILVKTFVEFRYPVRVIRSAHGKNR
ncbi:MAG: glycosyltransferase family 2 protein [Roseburia sp.]|jgi:glycosyltransferase involved in cell wall biosynthesis|nr:glycosyltransferase family 2 protein [Roseburia sp.]